MAKQLHLILAYPQTTPVVAAIWAATRTRLARCSACCAAWHAAQQELEQELRQLDAACERHQHGEQRDGHQQGRGAHELQPGRPPAAPADGRAGAWDAAMDARRQALAQAIPAIRRLDAERLQCWLEAGAAHALADGGGADGSGAGGAAGEAVDGAPVDEVLALALQETLIQ